MCVETNAISKKPPLLGVIGALESVFDMFVRRTGSSYIDLKDTWIWLEFCFSKTRRATTSCKSTWDTVPYFGLNGLSMILCLWPPLHPFSKLLAIQDHAQNLEEQLWMGGRRGVTILSHRPVTSSDLKQDKLFFREGASTFLQLVVAGGQIAPVQNCSFSFYAFELKLNRIIERCIV